MVLVFACGCSPLGAAAAARTSGDAPGNDARQLVAEFERGKEFDHRYPVQPQVNIGTCRSLQVACSYLRSPLKRYVPGVHEESVRDFALSAIGYNFPDERVLFGATSLSEWTAADVLAR